MPALREKRETTLFFLLYATIKLPFPTFRRVRMLCVLNGGTETPRFVYQSEEIKISNYPESGNRTHNRFVTLTCLSPYTTIVLIFFILRYLMIYNINIDNSFTV